MQAKRSDRPRSAARPHGSAPRDSGRLAVLAIFAASMATAQPAKPKPEDTEVWTPVPPKVASQPLKPAPPPAGAVVLFDGSNLDQWVSHKDGSPARWPIADGVLTVDKKLGDIRTKQSFRSYHMHIEWRIPKDITGSGQARGNSGVFVASTGAGDLGYELQILDSWDNATYVNGQAGSVYKQFAPKVNATRPPGEWQAYDIIWTAPTFDAAGRMKTPARLTAHQNGVLIQDNVTLEGETAYIGKPVYRPYAEAPIKLQAHGDPSEPVSFRNIWLQPLP